MKKLLPILVIVCAIACTKKVSKTWPGAVTWRFVLYDSNYRVVDSTPEYRYPDSALVTMSGPLSMSTIPPAGVHDTIVWPMAGSFFLLIGPSTLLPGVANIQVPSGGCAFNAVARYPTLDRSGWMLQRTENGKRIDMFTQPQNGYDGKYNDIPYPQYFDGVAYPSLWQQDIYNTNWVCGSTQGSCTMAPSWLY